MRIKTSLPFSSAASRNCQLYLNNNFNSPSLTSRIPLSSLSISEEVELSPQPSIIPSISTENRENNGLPTPTLPNDCPNLDEKTATKRRKTHYTTICIVPSPNDIEAWERLTQLRTKLRDPSLFRWPPHINLLYPFITIKRKEEEINFAMFETLYNITSKFDPFQITLNSFGTFGNGHRGVLWLKPNCSRNQESTMKKTDSEILQNLQTELQDAFPICHEQRKNGIYIPHLTLSHFPSLKEANDAKSRLEKTSISFSVNEIYLLKRFEVDGQFLMFAKLPLAGEGSIELYDTNALKFPFMPMIEEDWVYQERMKLKERRSRPRKKR